jgi:hypothetical protein
LDRVANFRQRIGHPQSRRLEWSPLVIVEDAAHRRAVGQDDSTRRVLLGRHPICLFGAHPDDGFRIVGGGIRVGRGTLVLEHGLFDLAEAADLAPHLNLRVTVGLENRLGHVAEEVVLAIAMRDAREFRRDPLDEGILLVRDPKHDLLTQG